jgi:predicted Rossmann fold nucleotide-binding protein DprA/Smf involved in DNA uptake
MTGSIHLYMVLRKIVSGGETGVDRAALDAALAVGFACGGWVTWDRMAEDGAIPERYPMTVLPKGGYRQRTRLNVSDSDGTVILYHESLKGGTRLTRNLCALLNRPYVLINAKDMSEPIAASNAILQFIEKNKVAILNVAGPRSSGWKEGYLFALNVIAGVIAASVPSQELRSEKQK